MKVKLFYDIERPVGMYLVTFDAIWGSRCTNECNENNHPCMDNEPDHIAEVDGNIIKITKDTRDADNMTLETNTNDQDDDTHDLRPRLFKTRKEAKEHMEYTLNKFKNPMPWQSFVKVN